jgi:hypothetical protein
MPWLNPSTVPSLLRSEHLRAEPTATEIGFTSRYGNVKVCKAFLGRDLHYKFSGKSL